MAFQDLKQAMHSVIDQGDERLLRMLLAISKEYQSISNEQLVEESVKQRSSSGTELTNDQLYRLVYTSARSSSCDDACIEKILESADRNNPAMGLTGILVYTPKRFLQILEGPYANVRKIYQKIEKDPRHGGSQMRYCEPTEERHFGNWHMAHKGIKNGDVDFATDVSDQEREIYAALMDGNLRDYKDEGMRVLKTFFDGFMINHPAFWKAGRAFW